MPTYPNPAGGSMEVANQAAAIAAGWTPSMGTFGSASAEPASSSTSSTGPGGPVGANVDVAQAAWNQGQQQALQAYYNAKLAGESEDRAFRRAQQAWLETMDRASMTGQFEGAPTLPSMMGYGEMFGQWGMPTQGQQTLAAQKQQQDTALGYLGLLGNMRGPQNYFQYQNVLGSTPQGMRDLVAAAMGQYIPGGGATTGVQPVAQSLQGAFGDVTGMGMPGQQQGYGSQVYNQQQQALASKLPAPNQIAPQSWANMAPSQRQLLMSAYENQGWNAEDVKGLFEQSLPKYGSTNPGAGTFKLV